MNILILNWKDIKNPEVGGAEVIAFEFARRLVKKGHKVVFFCRRFNNCRLYEIIDGVNIVRKGGNLSVYIYAFFYYMSLRKRFDKVIDMVNTICWQTPLYVSEDQRVAYVNQLAKEVFFFELPWPISILAYCFERFEYITYKKTKFICYSQSTKNDLMTFGIRSTQINTFSLGVDHTRYRKGIDKTSYPLFIFVARLVKMKRADLCVKAFSLLHKKYPNAKLAIIGNGPEENNLEELVILYNIKDSVLFINKNNFFIDKNVRDIKVEMMQKAWCLLLPSVKEGWGMVVTEAAACETPSIVSKVTGLVDSVIHNKTGIIISSNPTAEELAAAMIEIAGDSKYRAQLSKGAFEFSKKFSWDKSFRDFYRLLVN